MLGKRTVLKTLLYGLDPWNGYGVCIEIWNLVVALTSELYGEAAADWLKANQDKCDIAVDSNALYHYSIEGMDAKEILDKLESLKVAA